MKKFEHTATNFFVILILLASIPLSTMAFAKSRESNANSSCGKKHDTPNHTLKETTIADFKIAIRSVLSSKYGKKCSFAWVSRIDPQVGLSIWDEMTPNKDGDFMYFTEAMNPKFDPSVAHFLIQVEGLPYPILMVYRDKDIPIFHDFNKYLDDSYDHETSCRKCTDESGESPEKSGSSCACIRTRQCSPCGGFCGLCFDDQPYSPSLCFTATDSDREHLLSEIPVGDEFPL